MGVPKPDHPWRRRVLAPVYHLLAACLPVLGIPLYLAPVLAFVALHVRKGGWEPFVVVPATVLGVLAGAFLPARCFHLRPFEADGRLYARLGLRAFRLFVADGDLFRKLAEQVKPASLEHLQRSEGALAHRLAMTRWYERCHWAILLGTLPAFIWAVALGSLPWSAWFFVVCVLLNAYPILLQRSTRARLQRIQARAAGAKAGGG